MPRPDFETQHLIVRPRVAGAENMPTPFKIFNSAGEEIGYCRQITVRRELNQFREIGYDTSLEMPTSMKIEVRHAILNRHPDLDVSERYTLKVEAADRISTKFCNCYLTSCSAGHDSPSREIIFEEMNFIAMEIIEGLSKVYDCKKTSKKTIEWLERWTKH